jgi:hypothetical protein
MGSAQQEAERPAKQEVSAERSLVLKYCVDCHNADDKAGELALDAISAVDVSGHTDVWEMVVRKLRARQMPPFDV